MKKILLPVLLLFFTSYTFAQFDEYPGPDNGKVAGGLGLNWIDGELYYTFHFTPEISFANFGVGLDLQMDFDSKGNLRTENFNEFSDYLSIIRYARYGLKHDPVFVKLGALDYYTLGHGSIMYQYNNSPSFDSRDVGLVLDIDFGQFGFESIYSRFAEAGVIGLRGYVRPLKFTPAGDIPIIGNLEVGATYAGDYNDHAAMVATSSPGTIASADDKGSLNIVGFDIGLPIITTSLLDIQLYMDYAKIIDFGSGISSGIAVNLSGLGLVNAYAKLERRFNNDQYMPAYFNSLYEIERYSADSASGAFISKATKLSMMTNGDNGFYGELGINILNLLDIIGSYQRLDKTPNSGILHLETDISPEDASFVARAGYDKINIGSEIGIFTLDDNSHLYAEVGYKPVEYILVSMVYHWTFTPLRDSDDNIIGYEPQKRIEPRISFVYPFGFGG